MNTAKNTTYMNYALPVDEKSNKKGRMKILHFSSIGKMLRTDTATSFNKRAIIFSHMALGQMLRTKKCC